MTIVLLVSQGPLYLDPTPKTQSGPLKTGEKHNDCKKIWRTSIYFARKDNVKHSLMWQVSVNTHEQTCMPTHIQYTLMRTCAQTHTNTNTNTHIHKQCYMQSITVQHTLYIVHFRTNKNRLSAILISGLIETNWHTPTYNHTHTRTSICLTLARLGLLDDSQLVVDEHGRREVSLERSRLMDTRRSCH